MIVPITAIKQPNAGFLLIPFFLSISFSSSVSKKKESHSFITFVSSIDYSHSPSVTHLVSHPSLKA